MLKRVATVEAFPNFKDERNFHDSVITFPIKFNYFSRIIFQKSKFYKLRTRVLSNYPFLGIVIFNFKSSIQRFTIPLSQILNFWKTMTFTFIKRQFSTIRDPGAHFLRNPLYSKKIIFQKMEKDFFHFRRQYPITKKKTRVCVTQFDARNSSISFETRIELKIVSFTFESNFPIQEFARTCHQLVTKSIARRGWFSKNRILEFLGAVIFTPYFSISIRREGKGCIPNAPPGICAHVRAHWVQCT